MNQDWRFNPTPTPHLVVGDYPSLTSAPDKLWFHITTLQTKAVGSLPDVVRTKRTLNIEFQTALKVKTDYASLLTMSYIRQVNGGVGQP